LTATAHRKPFSIDHPVVVTFLLIAIVWSMSFAAAVLRPLALAVLLSLALAPLCRFLERRRLPRALAVLLAVVTPLVALGGVGYVVGQELSALVKHVRDPVYTERFKAKLRLLKPAHENVIDKALKVATDLAQTFDEPSDENASDLREPKKNSVVEVRVVSRPSLLDRVATALGPSLELLAMGFLVLILVIFLCMNREDLRDRVIQLFGRGRIAVTTRTMDEVGHRIGRYLAMFTIVNTTYGFIIGSGLSAIGLPYAVLWGFLAGSLRFIPYAGPAVAFLLPSLFAAAHFPTWTGPIEVVCLFLVLEVAFNSFLEPVIYGKTTGVSALGLLVCAMFWTWLWGALGLLLSTPMTVCLAVLGKYVPSLCFFATLLGEDAELEPELRYYQRLLAFDEEGAVEIVETALKAGRREDVFDHILVPALYRGERDWVRGELDDREQAFIWRVTTDILDDLDAGDMAKTLDSTSSEHIRDETPADAQRAATIVGVAASNMSDLLVLRMLAQLLAPAGLALRIVGHEGPPLNAAEQVAGASPDVIIVSHVPPAGLAAARYLVRRLRVLLPDLPIVVGRWSEHVSAANATYRFTSVGASHVVFRVAKARDFIVQLLAPSPVAVPDALAEAPDHAGAS
jgi:predicted PurR-regulated permease PerM